MSAPVFVSLGRDQVLSERLALAADGGVGDLETRSFPDGECYLRVESDVTDRDAVIVHTLTRPNDTILPLLFLADTLRELGAKHVGLVAPYLAYMRQDTRFHPGEAVTSRSFARLISRSVDWLITVDPHLHRIARLGDIYDVPATAIHVAGELGTWIAANVPSPFIIGPDAESRQWVDAVASAATAPSTVLTKIRRGDTDVVESIPDLSAHRACTPVLVDDIISTGETMLAAIEHLAEQKMPVPWCVAVHAVFAGGAYATLKGAGAARIATTNTIPHASNEIDIVPALATALRQQLSCV